MSDCTCTTEEYCPSCWERIQAREEHIRDQQLREEGERAVALLNVHAGSLIRVARKSAELSDLILGELDKG